MASIGCKVEGRGPVYEVGDADGLGAAVVLQQRIDYRQVPVVAGTYQGCATVMVLQAGVCTTGQQQRHYVVVPELGRPMKACPSIDISGVDGCGPAGVLQKGSGHRRMAEVAGQDQRCGPAFLRR
jgi:hypothetical protein